MMSKIYANFLLLIKSRLKIDAGRYLKNTFWLLSGYGLQIFSGLLLTIAFANFLDKESYGTFQFIIAAGSVLSAFALSGMATAVKRSVARGNEGALRYGFKIKMLWGFTTVFLSGAVALFYFLTGNNLLGKAFILFGLLMPWTDAFSLYKAYLTGTQRFKESSFLGLWRRPISTGLIILVLILTNDVLIILTTYLAANLLSVVLLYSLVVKKYNLPVTKDESITNYSKHQSFLGIIGTIGSNADKVLVYTLLGPSNAAIYIMATLPVNQFLKLFGFISSDLMFPKFAKESFMTVEKGILKKILLLFFAALIITILYIISAKYIFELFFPAYTEAVFLSQLAMLVLLVKPTTLLSLVFTAQGFKKNQYYLSTSSAVLRVTLLLTLIPTFGLNGAVMAFALAGIYWALATIVLFYIHRSKLHPKRTL